MAMGVTAGLEKEALTDAAVATQYLICKPGSDDDHVAAATGSTPWAAPPRRFLGENDERTVDRNR